jgi:hypothetical protein
MAMSSSDDFDQWAFATEHNNGHVLLSYLKYYNEVRTHLSLEKTRRFRAPSNGPEAFFVAQFSADYTTNMFGFDLRQGQDACAPCR